MTDAEVTTCDITEQPRALCPHCACRAALVAAKHVEEDA